MTDPITAQVRALDGINPADMGFRDAIIGGVLAVTSTRVRATRSAARRSR